MAYKIPEILTQRKVVDGVLLLSLCMLTALSFGLGRLSVSDVSATPVALCSNASLPASLGVVPEQGMTANVGSALPTPIATHEGQGATNGAQQGAYVASKTGSVYHLPWCSGAKRIKEENKVWFATVQEAEAAGYRPASNCKGL